MSVSFPILDSDDINVEVPPVPSFVTLSLTNICQQRCRFCYFNHEEARHHPVEIPLEVVKRMTWLKYTKEIVICGNGEALMHRQYPAIIDIVRRNAPDASIMLYTNGLNLYGKNLSATIQCVDKVYISQNAVRKKTYENIIYKGSYKRAMRNLELLSKMKPRNMHVQLGLVACKEALDDIYPLIDVASHYGFNAVRIGSYITPDYKFDYTLPEDSWCDITKVIDLKKLLSYAKTKNIELQYISKNNSNASICFYPYIYIWLHLDSKGRRCITYCCYGEPNISIAEEELWNLDKIWHNERVTLIRKTINNRFELYKNKMCLACRLVNRTLPQPDRNNALQSLGLDTSTGYLYGVGFPPLHLE